MKSAMFIDDDQNFLYLIDRLHKRGKLFNLDKMIRAENGLIALNYINENIGQETQPSALFVDINMPVMDGHEFLEKFRELRELHKELEHVVPIAVVTSSTSPLDRRRVEQSGLVEKYIVKDIELFQLAEQINGLLHD